MASVGPPDYKANFQQEAGKSASHAAKAGKAAVEVFNKEILPALDKKVSSLLTKMLFAEKTVKKGGIYASYGLGKFSTTSNRVFNICIEKLGIKGRLGEKSGNCTRKHEILREGINKKDLPVDKKTELTRKMETEKTTVAEVQRQLGVARGLHRLAQADMKTAQKELKLATASLTVAEHKMNLTQHILKGFPENNLTPEQEKAKVKAETEFKTAYKAFEKASQNQAEKQFNYDLKHNVAFGSAQEVTELEGELERGLDSFDTVLSEVAKETKIDTRTGKERLAAKLEPEAAALKWLGGAAGDALAEAAREAPGKIDKAANAAYKGVQKSALAAEQYIGDVGAKQKEAKTLANLNQRCDAEMDEILQEIKTADEDILEVQVAVDKLYKAMVLRAAVKDKAPIQKAFYVFKQYPTKENLEILRTLVDEEYVAKGSFDTFLAGDQGLKVSSRLNQRLERFDSAIKQKQASDEQISILQGRKEAASNAYERVQGRRQVLHKVEKQFGMTFEEAEKKGKEIPQSLRLAHTLLGEALTAYDDRVNPQGSLEERIESCTNGMMAIAEKPENASIKDSLLEYIHSGNPEKLLGLSLADRTAILFYNGTREHLRVRLPKSRDEGSI